MPTAAEIMTWTPPKTYTFHATFKARNGRRMQKTFDATYMEKWNDKERAAFISRVAAAEDKPLVHWSFTEKTKPFELGKTYRTLEGKEVTIISLGEQIPGYECVQGDDLSTEVPEGETPHGRWRYNRPQDRGRCTGSPDDCPYNLIPEPAE